MKSIRYSLFLSYVFSSLILPCIEMQGMQGKVSLNKKQSISNAHQAPMHRTSLEEEIGLLNQIMAVISTKKGNFVAIFGVQLKKLQLSSYIKDIGIRETKAAAIAQAKKDEITLSDQEINSRARSYAADLQKRLEKCDRAYIMDDQQEFMRQLSLLEKLIDELKKRLKAELKRSQEKTAAAPKNQNNARSLKPFQQEAKSKAENSKQQKLPNKIRIKLQNGEVEVPTPEFAAGFIEFTNIKVPEGWRPIQQLQVGDTVTCVDDFNCLVEGTVSALLRKSVTRYIELSLGTRDQNKVREFLRVAKDQRFMSNLKIHGLPQKI